MGKEIITLDKIKIEKHFITIKILFFRGYGY